MKSLVLNKNVADLYFDGETNSIVTIWNRNPKEYEYKDILEKGLQILKEKRANKWMADATNLGILSNNLKEWTITNWLPRAIENGYSKIAIIIPKGVFAQISLDQLITETNRNTKRLEQVYFSSFDEARDWIMK